MRGQTPARTRPARPARHFYSVAAAVMLIFMFSGFHPYYLRGEGMAGRQIAPELSTLVLVHGASMTGWLVLFFVQALLVPSRKLRVHMTLGWGAAAVAIPASVSGFMVAVESVRLSPAIPFWGMAYRQFMLIMLAEVLLFTLFVLAGLLSRKRPRIHRSMMLLASLSILAGATVRMPVLFPIFGESGWLGIFGPIFSLGALLLLARSLLGQSVDRWLALGYALMVAIYVGACQLAVSDDWSTVAETVFRV
jgi:hypothetical protein